MAIMSRTWLGREDILKDGTHWYEFYVESFDEKFYEELIAWCQNTLSWQDYCFGEAEYFTGPGVTHHVNIRDGANATLFKLTWC